MKDFLSLKKNLKKDVSNLMKLNVAILGDSATQFLATAIRGEGVDRGFNIELWEAEFNQIEQQVFDESSELYAKQPDIVIVFLSSIKLLTKYDKSIKEEQTELAINEIQRIEGLYNNITKRIKSKVIFFNYSEIDDSVFGNFALKNKTSFLFQLRKLNYELMMMASDSANMHLIDISTIQNRVGKKNLFQPSIYVNSDMVLSIDVLPHVATKVLDLIGAIHGNFKKCVIVDLDNTMWGGVIGDDGLENIQLGSLGIGKAFTDFQRWIKKLKNRGIIVAVCSKNTESIAKEPFEKHKEMILKLDDIAVFVANWENKADNIRQIQNILNIGFDSMVFLDDNPFERNLVRENIPEICVPELPEDPANYLEYLYSLNLFETVSNSKEDNERTKLYQIEGQRRKVKQQFTDVDEYLKSLEMRAQVEPFNTYNTPRVAQLTQRSNQFNLRTIRYTETEIDNVSKSELHHALTFSLEDKFGEHGLIAVLILQQLESETLFIDTWIMSCRVLKRGMENFVLNELVKFAEKNNSRYLKGEYIPTSKNGIVKDHYLSLGFNERDGFWELPVDGYKDKLTFVIHK